MTQVAGGKDESVTQPVWTPKNELLFVSDRTGWWNIYKYISPTQVCLWPVSDLRLQQQPVEREASLHTIVCQVYTMSAFS